MNLPFRSTPLGRVHLILNLETVRADARIEHRVDELLAAGLPSIQVRVREGEALDPQSIVAACAALRARAREAHAVFVVNGSLEAALRLEADGIHLSARSVSACEVRRSAGARMLVGRSAHDAMELARATDCDWAFLSPVFPTTSKPGASGLGLAAFARIAADAPVPVLALGGITRHRISACFEAGASGVAAISGLLSEDGVEFVHNALLDS